MTLAKWLIWAVVIYVGFVGLLYLAQRKLMYLPDSTRYALAAVGLPEAQEVVLDTMPLWMELYDHNHGETVDSFGSDELEAAVAAADELMRLGRQLSRGSGRLAVIQGSR